MEPLLIREQYKVIQVLYAEQNYAALQAVDIRDRGKSSCLLNVYEGDYLKPYLRCFHELRGCSSLREMFVWENNLIAVFDYREGKNIDQVFFRGARCSWRLRMKTAQSLFEQALSVWNFPPEIGCAALLSDNLIFLQEDSPLTVNFVVRPMEALQQRDMVFLLSDQIRKVLLQRWDSPIEERQFVRELCTGTAQSAAAAYNRWNATKPSIQAAYEKIESKNAMSRQLYLLFMNLKDWLRTRFHKQKGGRGH